MTRTPARIAATLALTGVMVAAGLIAASPASAAPVTDFTTLQAEFTGSGTSTLSNSISSPASELILVDNQTQVLELGAFNLTLHNIILGAGSTLTITGTTGVLTLDASDANVGAYADSRAGIKVPNSASLIIAGGTVNATAGGLSAAGIGAWGHGSFDGLGSISITGGTVNAVGAGNGAGIGGTAVLFAGDGSIAISGGTVTATGGSGAAGIGGGWFSHTTSITISGGTVVANGGPDAAAIGGGDSGGGAGTITISGGNITATTASGHGAAIGTGAFFGGGTAGSGTILITGGTINANSTAGSGAAIGAGYDNQTVDITISNATITATSGDGAGIGGGGFGDGNGPITINSGTFSILSGAGAGIGSGSFSNPGSITINDGTFVITADGGGAAIGGGFLSAASTIVLNGGTFTLVSETLAPVIGSGVAGGTGGSIFIASPVVASVSTDQTQTVVGGTNNTGIITLNGSLTILQGTLMGPTVGGLTIGTTGVLRGPGGLSGADPIVNNGSITGSVNVTATDILANNFLVTYSPDASTGYAGGSQRIYATTFDRAELPLADPVTGHHAQWFDAPVGGTLFTTSTVLADDITLFPLFSVEALAATGVETLVLLPIALLVLMLGAGLVLLRRRSAA